MDGLGSRIKKAWNAFLNKENEFVNNYDYGTYYKPDRVKLTVGNERSIVTSIINRIALDVASLHFCHCRLDDGDRFKEELNTGLNNCLTLGANIDQTSYNLIQDCVMSMLDEGSVALIPIDTTINPKESSSYDILSLRTGKITQWYPNKVKVSVYNERIGRRQEIIVNKKDVAIIENPFYSVMNEPNSTAQRLNRKLNLLDVVDEQSSSGKLDLIIQLPYGVKTELRKKQANERASEVERQLKNSKYGIAYIDGTEKITQLNRPVENNLMKTIEYLTSMLYGQLGITQAIMDGTADEKTMLNYYSRTIEPIAEALKLEMIRKFISKTGRSQKQTIMYFRDPFKLVPINNIAEIADKFTRNEILSSNELRQIIGRKPSDDPKADQLINSNLNHAGENEDKNVPNNNYDKKLEEKEVTDERL